MLAIAWSCSSFRLNSSSNYTYAWDLLDGYLLWRPSPSLHPSSSSSSFIFFLSSAYSSSFFSLVSSPSCLSFCPWDVHFFDVFSNLLRAQGKGELQHIVFLQTRNHVSFTDQLLCKLALGQASCYASQLLHKLVFTQATPLQQLYLVYKLAVEQTRFFTIFSTLTLHQLAFAQPSFTPTSFYTSYLLHKLAVTQTSFYTNQLLKKKNYILHRLAFTQPFFWHNIVFKQTNFYTNQLLRQPAFTQTAFTPRGLYIARDRRNSRGF